MSCWDDGTHAGGIVDEFEEVGFLRRVCVVNDKPRGDLTPVGVEDAACVIHANKRLHDGNVELSVRQVDLSRSIAANLTVSSARSG